MMRWRKSGSSSTPRWDWGAPVLILAILLTGVLSKLDLAWWAILAAAALCALLASVRRYHW